MTRENWMLIGIIVYGVCFALIPLGVFVWKVKHRGGRSPLAFKLLRGPGESLRRRMAKFDEDLPLNFLIVAFGPFTVGFSAMFLAMKLLPQTWTFFWSAVAFGVVVLSLASVFAYRSMLAGLTRYRNDRLGYLGEREVAEHLRPLLARGYHVFHDVPAEGETKEFNLDHVAVGPAGVVLIEVKTRRKGRARPGMRDHVVTFDGQQLIWPWGEDRHGLDQAMSEAEWLKRFLFERLGLDTPVRAVLALPGWWVEEKVRGPVAVVNSKNIAYAVEGRGPRILSDQEIDLISRQLDTLCRDVED